MEQIDLLANYIMAEVEGEPSQSEGAGDCAIRIIKQLKKENEALKNILWYCRHGGKGGVPVDYQGEVDRLLATHQ